MFLAKVIGRVWSTVKDPRFEGQRLLLIQPVTPEMQPTGRRQVVADATHSAGAGELVYCCRGRESSFPWLPLEVPIDTSIVAIVDELHIDRAKRC